MPRSLAIIINPIAGAGSRPGRGPDPRAFAQEFLRHHGARGDVSVTRGSGHARELAAAAVASGCDTIVAWGGDGTVNEVASAVAFSEARLAIIPRGSGNGLARHLRIPSRPTGALAVALAGTEVRMDVGELDGCYFVNVAGAGIDAVVAHAFARAGAHGRGLRRYVLEAIREVRGYRASRLSVVADGVPFETRPLLLTLANGSQYGNGVVVSGGARIDDGRLDLVVAVERRAAVALCQAPMLFLGGATRLPGVTSRLITRLSISGEGPLRYHVDGEPRTGGPMLEARVHPGALRVAIPVT